VQTAATERVLPTHYSLSGKKFNSLLSFFFCSPKKDNLQKLFTNRFDIERDTTRIIWANKNKIKNNTLQFSFIKVEKKKMGARDRR
jgi:hypothetical protein